MRPVESDQGNPTTSTTERPLRICVVFDDDTSASSAEVLIRHLASEYECDTHSFHIDELDRPAPVVAVARSASDADILDAGHFALDEQAGEVIRLTAAFMRKLRETGIK